MPSTFGPTGKFPRGKLGSHDEGELTLGVATDLKNGVVIIKFGKDISWLGFEKDRALQFAELIKKHAEELPDV